MWGSVYCKVRSVSDVTPTRRGEINKNASISEMKNKNVGQSRGMGGKINLVLKGLKNNEWKGKKKTYRIVDIFTGRNAF
jgi:hypothetical protein